MGYSGRSPGREIYGEERRLSLGLGRASLSSATLGEDLSRLGAILKNAIHIQFCDSVSSTNADAVVQYSGKITIIDLWSYHYDKHLCRILEARGKQLYSLKASFRSPEMTRAITEHCTELREL